MYDRDAVLAVTDLTGLADELLGPRAGTEHRPMWRCPSPLHEQSGRTPPVSIFDARWGEQRWHCHGCGDGGTALDLIMRARNLNVREAFAALAQRAGLGPGVSCVPAASPLDRPTGRPKLRAMPTLAPERAQALDAYVDRCVDQLWSPAGRPAQRWLMRRRGLTEDVLRANRIGADLGDADLCRPDGLPRHGGAVVLPVLVAGTAVYLQHRVLHPQPSRPRYLNPPNDLAPNPRLSQLVPAEQLHDEIIVTEGAIDGLTAAAAGYRAVALLSAAYADRYVAHQIARADGPLLLALDPDPRGRSATTAIVEQLEDLQRPATVLRIPADDLNDLAVNVDDWPSHLPKLIAHAQAPTPVRPQIGLAR